MRRLLLVVSLLLLAAAPAARAEDRPGWTPVDCSCAGARSIEAVNASLVFLGTSNGINRSTDGGFTWHVISTPVDGEVRRISFAGEDDGLAMGGFEGVLVTHDGGSTWKQFRPWSGRTTDVTALPGRLLALSESGLYASTDGGVVWKQVHGAFPGSTPRMDWSSPTTGMVVSAPDAYTTTDGGGTFTEAKSFSVFLFDALSTGASSGLALGQDSTHSGHPWVMRVTAATKAAADLAARGVADEQERGASSAGGAMYAVGIEGLIARSTDGGTTWAYEKAPPSYERASFYDVDSVDADHAWIAVYSGRVLIRDAPRLHDIQTSPHRGLGLGLLGLGALGVLGAGAAVATGRKPIAAGLAVTAVVVGAGGYAAVTDHGSCPASGCTTVVALPDDGAVQTPAPSAPPTPSATPSPTATSTPSPTPSPTGSPTASPTPSVTASPTPRRTTSPTPSPTRTGAFTAVLTKNPTCDPNGGAHPGTLTLRNTTSAPVSWTAVAREQVTDPQTQQQSPWAALAPAQGILQSGAQVAVSVTPADVLCTPGNRPTTEHVDVKHGAASTAVAVTVNPQS